MEELRATDCFFFFFGLNLKLFILDTFVEELKADGSHNIVNLYQDNLSGELRVIKSLPNNSNNEELEREENMLRKGISSPYIVKYNGFFVRDGCKCFVMEYCGKRSLRDLIDSHKNQNKKISEEVFFFFFLF
jgi:serine/threonine protein kinase